MIATLADLIKAALEQKEQQRLLFLFAKTESKKKKKKKHQTGTITPLMCVDKLPEEIVSFKALVEEADNISTDWDIMLIAGLSGTVDAPPTTDDAEPHLNKMANDLTSGQELSSYVIFDRKENPIVMQPR